MSLNNALGHLQEADAVGKATSSKMEAQTKRLEKMNTDMDQISGNLDTTEAIVGDMEKGYMQYLGESALGCVGIDCSTKVESKVDTSTPAIKEGWLEKRGPMFGYKWERRWCSLFSTGLLYYDDEAKADRKGDVDIKKATKVFSFQKNKAPGDAIKHRGEKPFGFVVDVTPSAGGGKERRLFYFDAPNKTDQTEWMDAIDAVARKLKKKDKDNDGIDGGAPIDQINNVLDDLMDTAVDLGDQARTQAKLVKEVTVKVDTTTVRLDDQTERLKKM